MKKDISLKLFATVLHRGICQVLKWIGNLFGYRDQSTYGVVVWRIFAGSAAAIMFMLAFAVAYAMYLGFSERISQKNDGEEPETYQYLSRNISYCNSEGGDGFIYNDLTGEKLLKHVQWIAKPVDGDSLICYCDGKKRGYFSKYTGKVIIEPEYDKAWIFSDGVAAVEKKGELYFIDHTNERIMDRTFVVDKDMDGYRFAGGYCAMNDANNNVGLIDKSGNWVIQPIYDNIRPVSHNYWSIMKDDKYGLLSDSLKMIYSCDYPSIFVTKDEGINITLPDYTQKICDYTGKVVTDFVITDISPLIYNADVVNDSTGELAQAVAKCREYYAVYNHYGLIDRNGKPITLPIYKSIRAIDYDRYLCEVADGRAIVIDGMGQNVNE